MFPPPAPVSLPQCPFPLESNRISGVPSLLPPQLPSLVGYPFFSPVLLKLLGGSCFFRNPFPCRPFFDFLKLGLHSHSNQAFFSFVRQNCGYPPCSIPTSHCLQPRIPRSFPDLGAAPPPTPLFPHPYSFFLVCCPIPLFMPPLLTFWFSSLTIIGSSNFFKEMPCFFDWFSIVHSFLVFVLSDGHF